MKKDVLDRYERMLDNKIIIDVSALKIEDLYNNYDKIAPYVRRDLEQELVDYLIDCAKELGDEEFVIRFSLQTPPDDDSENRVQKSIKNYFLYLVEINKQEIKKILRRSILLFISGIIILTISVWVNKLINQSVIVHVFAEGLIIAAWISLWEATSTFIVEWSPHHREIKLFNRIANADIVFK